MTHPALDAFGDLDAAAADPHVAGCARCQADLAAQREVRDLLAGLPDPGPVPDDVVERIGTTLRQLAAAEPLGSRVGAGASAPGPDGPQDAPSAGETVVPITAARSARRRHPLLAVAAAAALVGAGGYGLTQVLPGSSAGSDSAASGGLASIADRSQPGSAQKEAGAGTRSIASGQDYRKADLAAQVDRVLRGSARAAAAPTGPLASPLGVASCVSALGAGAVTPLLVDVARFEGQPAAVVVLPATGGGREIWVVSTTCEPGQDGTKYFVTTR